MPHAFPPTPEWTETLARNFAFALKADIGLARLAVVVERNHEETDPSVCHSHDFTDANQVMIDVLETDEFSPEDCELINAVWELAKQNDFYLSEMQD